MCVAQQEVQQLGGFLAYKHGRGGFTQMKAHIEGGLLHEGDIDQGSEPTCLIQSFIINILSFYLFSFLSLVVQLED